MASGGRGGYKYLFDGQGCPDQLTSTSTNPLSGPIKCRLSIQRPGNWQDFFFLWSDPKNRTPNLAWSIVSKENPPTNQTNPWSEGTLNFKGSSIEYDSNMCSETRWFSNSVRSSDPSIRASPIQHSIFTSIPPFENIKIMYFITKVILKEI